ncbi:DUF4190 domain-containing protein [Agromyces bracchium]|uniref:DUF4190 domain-containing protein n=1 Tax=Agromyces bracchium TaxID=88376 RepID=A0A6I3M9A5_9MICO|nr:DUF4190 domain-containing protein [Agromyces bracchium]MTH69795.1 hypothetical protein [Agromyces bracchium]
MGDERMPASGEPAGESPEPRAPASPPAEPAVPPTPARQTPPPPASPAPSPAPPREFDVPYDTGALHGLPTGQLLAVGRPQPEQLEVDYEEEDEQRRVYSRVGAVIGSIGAVASLFVGWMFPLSVAAIVFGVLGLRREEHGRILAFIGIGTGVAGLVFSGVWLGYYAIVFGALPTA